jgi:hypothetical protein
MINLCRAGSKLAQLGYAVHLPRKRPNPGTNCPIFGGTRRSLREDHVSMSVKVYVNEDDALLFWNVSEVIPGCRGFAIARRKSNSSDSREEFLPNRIGFENQPAPTPGPMPRSVS